MAKEIVVTIHGVNPDRQWQESVGRVLSPHFDCRTFSYHGYDRIIGPVRAVANITTLILAAFLFTASIASLFLWTWFIAILLLTGSVVCFPASIFLAWLRRVRHVNYIKRQIDRASAYGRPHVVAHSLGTYLIGGVLRKFHGVRLGKLVLVSSVLPQDYPWQHVIETRPDCVRSVRNEYGTTDPVTKLVGRLEWLVRDLGQSGAVGFDEDQNLVHFTKDPSAPCGSCRPQPVLLHNVPLERYGHSDVFLGEGHARQLWLPYLWGFVPDEFLRYLDTCLEAARRQEEGRWNEVDKIVLELWGSKFTWTGGKTLSAHVHEVVVARLRRPVPARLPTADEIVEETMVLLHIAVAEACSEVEKSGAIDESVARSLHPLIAIARAVERAVG